MTGLCSHECHIQRKRRIDTYSSDCRGRNAQPLPWEIRKKALQTDTEGRMGSLPAQFWSLPGPPPPKPSPKGQKEEEEACLPVDPHLLLLFLIWTIFKVFIEFVTILLLWHVWVFWPWGMGNLASWPRIKPATPALEGELLTIGPPGKSLNVDLKTFLCLGISEHWMTCFITQCVLYICVQRLDNHQWGHGGRAYCTDSQWNGWGLRSYMFGETEFHSPTEPACF